MYWTDGQEKIIYKHLKVSFQGKPFNTTVIQVYALTTDAKEAEANWFYEDLQHLLELKPNWSAKVGSQDILGITGKFGLRVQNEARQRTFWS